MAAKSRRLCRSNEFERRGELDGLVQSALQRAAHGIDFVRTLDCRPSLRGRHQTHGHVDASDDKYALLSFDFTSHIGRQFSIAGIDLARIQRASKSAQHSTRGCGNDIIRVEACDSLSVAGSIL